MNKLRYLAVCLLLMVVALPMCLADDTELVKVAQFGKEKFLLYLPLYMAVEEGYFAEEGLRVDLTFAGNDDQVFASVLSGEVDFGISDPVFAAIAREKGGPGKVVALLVQKLGLSGFAKPLGLGKIAKPDDLAETRIGSLPRPSTMFTLLTQLMKRHALLGRTSIVPVPIGGQMAALEAGVVDIAVDLEPAVSIAESAGYRVVFPFDNYMEPQAITGVTTVDRVIEQKPHTVQRFVRGIDRALRTISRDHTTAIRVAHKIFPRVSPAIIAAAVNRMLAAGVFPPSAAVDNDLWQRSLGTRLLSGELRAPQATNVTVDSRFLTEGSGLS